MSITSIITAVSAISANPEIRRAGRGAAGPGVQPGAGVSAVLVLRPAISMDKNASDIWTALCAFAQWDGEGRDIAGTCAVSLRELAAFAQVCTRTASKGLSLLAEEGLVRAERVTSGGKILTTRYTLLPWGRASQGSR